MLQKDEITTKIWKIKIFIPGFLRYFNSEGDFSKEISVKIA